jgi:REP element-mobilizing transposase RayT
MASQYRTRNYRPGELVHLTCRGFKRQRIFLDEYDHKEFIDTFRMLNQRLPRDEQLIERADAQLANHQHRLVTNGNSPTAITQVMHSLQIRYAQHFNWRYRRHGKVFEKPFRGKLVRGVEHTMSAFVYIHLNPDDTLRLTNSSHGVYAGLRDDPHIDTSLAIRVFGGQEGYIEFFNDSARLRSARRAARRRFEW